jgi:C-terminal processing protease CtpA/Prc
MMVIVGGKGWAAAALVLLASGQAFAQPASPKPNAVVVTGDIVRLDSPDAQAFLTLFGSGSMVGGSGNASGSGNMVVQLKASTCPLGIDLAPIDSALADQLDLSLGLIISRVDQGGSGAAAGLLLHDVLLNVDQRPVKDVATLNELLSGKDGKSVSLGILRKGKPHAFEAKVPQQAQANTQERGFIETGVMHIAFDAAAKSKDVPHYIIGVSLAEADATLRSQLKIPAGKGLVVTAVVHDGPAAKSGVKLHDVLLEFDGKGLTTVDAVNSQIQEVKERVVALKLMREGGEVKCTVTPVKHAEEPLVASARLQFVDFDSAGLADILLHSRDAGRNAADAELAAVKKQLADLTKSVEKLESTIKAAPKPEAASAPKK